MIKIAFSLFFISASILLANPFPKNEPYQHLLIERAGDKMAELSTFPSLKFPNAGHEELPSRFPKGKVLLFGYGSLMNPASAARSVNADAVASMRPAIAFGMKRIFNYKASKTTHWGENQHSLEKAMLNLTPTTTYQNMVNGVVMEVDEKNFSQLVEREKGYDLMPILVADWESVTKENPDVEVKIAYTFIAPDELRDGVKYTQTPYYPVRGYLKATREGALVYGKEFLNFWNETTYLANGTTVITDWDEETFKGELCTKES